jgi:hypothetical protein
MSVIDEFSTWNVTPVRFTPARNLPARRMGLILLVGGMSLSLWAVIVFAAIAIV